MGHKFKTDEELLHPRIERPSTTVGVQQDIKKPSLRIRKKWLPLVDMAMLACLGNEPRQKNAIKNKIRISFTKGKTKVPDDFPKGRIVAETEIAVTREYNADIVLLWLWERKLSDYSPSMLYKKRFGYLREITLLENELTKVLDIEADSAYNGCIGVEGD